MTHRVVWRSILAAAMLLSLAFLPVEASGPPPSLCMDAEVESLIRLGQFKQAFDAAESRLTDGALTDQQRIALGAGALDAAVLLSRNDLASILSDELYKASKDLGEPACEARSFWAKATLAGDRADLAVAEESARTGLDIVRTLTGPVSARDRLAARFHRALGNAYRWSGRLDQATAELRTALALWRSTSDRWGEAGDLNNLAIVESELGDLGNAIDHSEAAKRIAGQLGDAVSLARALENLGSFYSMLGQDERSMANGQEVLKIYQQSGDQASEAIAHINLAHKKLIGKSLDKAAASYDMAERLIDPKNQERAFLALQEGRAELAAARFDGTVAERFAESCLTIANRRNDPKSLGSCSLAMSGALQAQGKTEAASERARFALMIGEEHDFQSLIFNAAANLQIQHASQGENSEAIRYGKRALASMLELQQSMENRLSPPEQANLVEAYRYFLVRLADLLLVESRLQEGQQVLRLLKLRDLNTYLRHARGPGAAEGDLPATADEMRWRNRYDQLASTLRMGAGSLSITMSEARRRFLDFLENADTGKPSAQPPDRVLTSTTTTAWQARLRTAPQGTVLVQYLVAPDHLDILLTSKDEQIARRVKTTGGLLGHSIGPFLRAVRDPQSDALAEAQAAYQVLIAAIEDDLVRLGAKCLWLSLDGVLRYVPFAALHDGKQWLVQRYASVVIAEALGPPPAERPFREELGAGFGVSAATGEFEALTHVGDELKAIFTGDLSKANDGRFRGRIYLDEAFTRGALQRSLEQEIPVVHLATHFKLSPGSEVDSYLLLGDGHRLSVKDLREPSLPFGKVDLLTLSACDTAVDGDGNEIEGLSAVAQRKGARTVVASLWRVSDMGTERLMRRFYSALRSNGFDRALALQQAQRDFLRQGATSKQDNSPVPILKRPYFWAPFVVMGAAK